MKKYTGSFTEKKKQLQLPTATAIHPRSGCTIAGDRTVRRCHSQAICPGSAPRGRSKIDL